MSTQILLIILFWAGLALVVYTYFGYGLLAAVIVHIRQRWLRKNELRPDTGYEPTVTLVVAAYNEADAIRAKLFNSLRLDYPREKLELLFVTDGCSDETPEVVSRVPGVRHLHASERAGKIAAMNRAMEVVTTEVVVFCDANTMLNRSAVREIVKWYADPSVGGVAGEKRVVAPLASGGGVQSESLYWRYESFLKRLDSRLWSVVGAAGELFSVRTELFETIRGDTVLDDFVISLGVASRGYRIVYEPEAYACEPPSVNIKEELKRKVRICAGGFQAMIRLKDLLSIRRHGLLAFEYISHRVLRWTLAPLFLLLLPLLNVAIVVSDSADVYKLALAMQLLFWSLAGLGWAFRRYRTPPWISAPFYFAFMNYAVYRGLLRYLAGGQEVAWERAARLSPS